MGTNRTTWMAAVLGTVAVAGMMGCHKNANNGAGMGAATINANVKLAIGDIASLTVVVQGGTMPSAITVPLVKKGLQFSALVSDLPVGTNYSFTASAKDASNVELYHGAVTNQTIVNNQTANIVINMNQDAPGVAISNSAPVIDSITATTLALAQNGTATINAVAHDPDAGQTALMAWAWATTCGSVSSPVNTTGSDTVKGTSQVVFTAPAADGPCTVNLTVTDANGVLKNVASLTITVNAAASVGSAKITAIPDTYPVISGLNATPVPLNKGVATTLSVTATDADGDALNYAWSSPCTGVFGTATAATTTFTLDSASSATSCDFVVVVNDGNFPDGTAKGGVITNHLTLPVFVPSNNSPTGAPVFGYDYQSQDTISGGDVVKMAIVANQGCAAPGVITLAWTSSDSQVLGSITPASIGLDATLFNPSAASYTAPAGAENGSVVTITVTATCSSSLLTAAHVFTLVPLNSFCSGKPAGTDCTSVASGSDKCVTAAACNSAGACVATTSTTCSQSTDQCKTNACVPSTGLCALANKPDSTPCNDNNACTGVGNTDQCGAGVCTGGTAVVCTQPANTCLVATCNTTSGACGNSPKADGTTCSDGLACTTSDICATGTCGGTAVLCATGFSCSEPTGSCDPITIPACMSPSLAKKLVPPLMGIGVSASGTPWITGNIFNPFDFGSGSVTSSGSADIYLAKMDPTTNLATQTFTFGNSGGNDQVAGGVAVASSDNVAMIGTFTGEIDFTGNYQAGAGPSGVPGTAGLDFVANASAIPFYAVLDGTSTGTFVTPKFAHMVDLGTGTLLAVGSNPTQNAFAICGKTSKVVAAFSSNAVTKGLILPTGTATAGGGMDIIVAKIDGTTGQVIWGRQFGGAGDQICESVAVDNNGDVIIAGGYTGTLNFAGTTTALPVVSDTTMALLYVAKLKSADGTGLVAQTWGTAGRTDAYALTIDAGNNIVVAGSLGGNIAFSGTISITDLGLTDAFVAKFTTALVPVWAKSFGDANFDQTAKAVAVSSAGDVFVGGSFKGSMGSLAITSASTTALDAWTVQLASADGSVICSAKAYGDAAGAQAVGAITQARTATGALANSVMMGGAFSSQIQLGTTLLDTGSASVAASYITRVVP
ncbi:MAG TPA: hypothetical protein VF550_01730 [Polyangia bacterium]